jgi:hypothetical protein
MLWESQTETQDTEAIQQEAMFFCASIDLIDSYPKAKPENQGVSCYIPLQAGYRSKKQGVSYIWLHANIQATSLSCYVTFSMFRFLKFYLHYAIPSSQLLYQNTGLSVSLLVLLPATR